MPQNLQRIYHRTPEILIRNDIGHHVDLLSGELLPFSPDGTRHVLVQVHHHGGHMMGGQVEPRERAKRSHRFGVNSHDLCRESPCRLRLPVLEHRIDGAAVVFKGLGPVAGAIAQVTRAVERDPSEARLRRAGLLFQI